MISCPYPHVAFNRGDRVQLDLSTRPDLRTTPDGVVADGALGTVSLGDDTRDERFATTPRSIIVVKWDNEEIKGTWVARELLVQADESNNKAATKDVVWHELPAPEKVKIIEAMGFVPMGDAHEWDCEARWDTGLRCNCVPPATWWEAPEDVRRHRHETWDERLKRAKAREGGEA